MDTRFHNLLVLEGPLPGASGGGSAITIPCLPLCACARLARLGRKVGLLPMSRSTRSKARCTPVTRLNVLVGRNTSGAGGEGGLFCETLTNIDSKFPAPNSKF